MEHAKSSSILEVDRNYDHDTELLSVTFKLIGTSISDHKLAMIFQPSRSKMGLFVASKIVQKLKGKIVVTSS